MAERSYRRPEGRWKRSLLPVVLSALTALPNNPFVARAAAAVFHAGEGPAFRGVGSSDVVGSAAASGSIPRIVPLSPPLLAASPGALPAAAAAAYGGDRSMQASAPEVKRAPTAAAPGQSENPPTGGPRNVVRNALSQLQGMFPGANKKAAPEPMLDETFDGALPADQIKAYVVQPGKVPVATDLAGLKKALSEPGLVAELNKHGHMTYVVGDKNPGRSLSRVEGEMIVKTLDDLGVSFGKDRTRIETLVIAWGKESPAADAGTAAQATRATISRSTFVRATVAAGVVALGVGLFGSSSWYQAGLAAYLVSNADRIVRETVYCFRTLITSFKDSKRPLPSEILGALATKIPAFTMNLAANLSVYAPALGIAVLGVLWPSMALKIHPGASHWLAFTLATAWSLCLETFHGAWVRTWDTFQNRIGKQRGPAYQSLFGFVYMQLTGGIFRTIAYLTLPNVFPLWDIRYLESISWMTIVGTLCGVCGFRGLNELYDKGRITAKRRSNIQQLRDLCWLAIGPFFNSGNMFMTGIFFLAQQSLDLAIYFINRKTSTRPILVFTDASVAASKEFPLSYPVDPRVAPTSPWKYATDALKGFVLLKPFLALYQLIKKL